MPSQSEFTLNADENNAAKYFVIYYFSILRLALLISQYPTHVLKLEITIDTIAISSTVHSIRKIQTQAPSYVSVTII
jgi:hypothetical protein